MVHIDDVAVTMSLGHMPVRVLVGLRALPALVLVLVVLVIRVLDQRLLMLENRRILPRPRRAAAIVATTTIKPRRPRVPDQLQGRFRPGLQASR